MRKKADQFQTIRTEGAILPPDVLRRIAAQSVDGVSPESYHLPPSLKLNESISHSWNLLRAHWKAFQEARQLMASTEETGTSVTNERWMLPLFQELGYGRLITSKAPEIDGRLYPIERFYNHVPVHLIGCMLPLDRRTRGARGAATSSPHSMVQEYLNRSEESLWGMVSNGLQLRLLRDNVSLSRQAFVEFDLEAMMEGEVYADFALLWLVCHQSRLEAPKQKDCWLEKWSGLAREQGTRVLESLRKGVQDAIEALGRGFISHPKNDGLRQKLRDGGLSTQDYYRQLLRIVYRLLFLFVAEDRGLLHSPDAAEDACQLYDEYYSTARLRRLAQTIRGSKHHDLWATFSLVCDALGRNDGCPTLGLSGLGSFLWRRSSTPDLLGPAAKGADPVSEPVLLANDDLLSAVRALAYVEQDRVLRSVDYRNLGSEELGSVYESLLELHPVITIEARTFSLSVAGGNERKTSGSYYTPDSLVQCLLDSALEPVIAETIKGKKADEAEKAILDLKVCDPACGSGHFLIAAAHRLARQLARVRTGESEPSPEEYQHALRNVIGRCIYGVDLNPMAVELCEVSLWIEALEPGKPLSFLDHHIQQGNSLLGATPALMARGIPDTAFDPIEGDDKKVCAALKKKNKAERAGQTSFAFDRALPASLDLGNVAEALLKLDDAPDGTLDQVTAKAERYAELVTGSAYENNRLLADTWCAAFVVPKLKADPLQPRIEITHDVFRRMRENPHATPWGTREEIKRLSRSYQFFHWHLAFPDVFQPRETIDDDDPTDWIGGFDCVLGNPPWERITIRDKEWFSNRASEIARAGNATVRAVAIDRLSQTDQETYRQFESEKRRAAAEKSLTRETGLYPLCGHGDVNLFALFAERAQSLLSRTGSSGLILPTGIATTKTTAAFFENLVTQRRLVSIFDFDNRGGTFQAVQGNVRFCLLTTAACAKSYFTGASFLLSPEDLSMAGRKYLLGLEDLRAINPNTLGCPLFASERDAEVAKSIYLSSPILAHSDPRRTPWRVELKRMFHMGDDAHLFRSREALIDQGYRLDGNVFTNGADTFVPLYESKLAFQFNHRAATFDGIPPERRFGTHPATTEVLPRELLDPSFLPLPRYWMSTKDAESKLPSRPGLLSFRNAISATADSRSLVATILPRRPAGDSLKFIFSAGGSTEDLYLAGCLNSFVVDYVLRQKASGGNASLFIIEQLPVAKPSDEINSWLRPRLLEVVYTAWDLESFASACGWFGPPFRWDEDRRFLLRCELDAAFFHLYLPADISGKWRPTPGETAEDPMRFKSSFPTPRDAVAYIMDMFPIVRRKDEEKYNSDYRTKRVILEIYDALAESIRTGEPYQTRLEPPPADPRCCHPPRANRMPPAEAVEVEP